MNKPKTLKELYNLVNPEDLNEVVEFSGINDKSGSEHWNIKRTFANMIWNSKGQYGWKSLKYINKELTDKHYKVILKCLQDFYYWSRQFNHIYAHIYRRVQNALNIPIEDISIIMDKTKR